MFFFNPGSRSFCPFTDLSWNKGSRTKISCLKEEERRENIMERGNMGQYLKTLTHRHNFVFRYLIKRCIQFSTCPTLCHRMDCSTPGFPVHHQLLELAQSHVHWVSDAILPSYPLPSPSPPAFNLPQHQGLFQWISSSHQVAKVLELQLQCQSFQWIFRTDCLSPSVQGTLKTY